MSNNRENINWEIDDEEDDDFMPSFESDTDLVRKLRKDLKQAQKRNKELEGSLGELSKAQRERIIKDAFASKGVNPKIASFVPQDIDASEEAVTLWLENYADVFGIKTEEKQAVSQEDIQNMQRMNDSLTGAEAPAASDDLMNRLSNASSEDEILSILSGQQKPHTNQSESEDISKWQMSFQQQPLVQVPIL